MTGRWKPISRRTHKSKPWLCSKGPHGGKSRINLRSRNSRSKNWPGHPPHLYLYPHRRRRKQIKRKQNQGKPNSRNRCRSWKWPAVKRRMSQAPRLRQRRKASRPRLNQPQSQRSTGHTPKSLAHPNQHRLQRSTGLIPPSPVRRSRPPRPNRNGRNHPYPRSLNQRRPPHRSLQSQTQHRRRPRNRGLWKRPRSYLSQRPPRQADMPSAPAGQRSHRMNWYPT